VTLRGKKAPALPRTIHEEEEYDEYSEEERPVRSRKETRNRDRVVRRSITHAHTVSVYLALTVVFS